MNLHRYAAAFVTGMAIALVVLCALELFLEGEANGDGDLIKLKQVYVDYKYFLPKGHDPLITENGIPNRTLGQGLDLTVDTDLLDWLYWDSTVHSATDQVLNDDGSTAPGQFRMVGLETGLGIDFRRFSDLPVSGGYHHLSEHMLDGSYPWHFPVQDSVEIKLYLFDGKGAGR